MRRIGAPFSKGRLQTGLIGGMSFDVKLLHLQATLMADSEVTVQSKRYESSIKNILHIIRCHEWNRQQWHGITLGICGCVCIRVAPKINN